MEAIYMFGSNTDLEAIISSEHLFTFSVVSSLALHSANTSRFPSMMLIAVRIIILTSQDYFDKSGLFWVGVLSQDYYVDEGLKYGGGGGGGGGSLV